MSTADDISRMSKMVDNYLKLAAEKQVLGREKEVMVLRGKANLLRRAIVAMRETQRLREALTRYGARHDVDCPMNPESGHQPPLRCTCGLLEKKD